MQRIILVLFFIVNVNSTRAAIVDLNVMKKWENKYPTSEKPKNRDIFHVKSFKKALSKILSKEDYIQLNPLIAGPSVQSPLTKSESGDVLSFTMCKAHMCNDYMFNFYISLKSGELSVCKKMDDKITWFGPMKELKKGECP